MRGKRIDSMQSCSNDHIEDMLVMVKIPWHTSYKWPADHFPHVVKMVGNEVQTSMGGI